MPTGRPARGTINAVFNWRPMRLAPGTQVIAPWRIEKFRQRFPGRSEMIAFCEQKKIPVKASVAKPYSTDENCLHISYEAGKLEDLTVNGVELVDFGMTVSPQQAPDKIESITIGFEAGVPVTLNGQNKSPLAMVQELNKIGGRNGIGRIDMVENRFVGMKSRGVYEAPGMTILYAAHQAIEQLTLDRDLLHLRDRLAPEVAEMVYYGFWYTAKMDALMAFIREAQKTVDGEVHAESVQRQHHGRRPQKSEKPVRRRHRQHGRRRQLQPDRRRRVFADPGTAVARPRPSYAAELLSGFFTAETRRRGEALKERIAANECKWTGIKESELTNSRSDKA